LEELFKIGLQWPDLGNKKSGHDEKQPSEIFGQKSVGNFSTVNNKSEKNLKNLFCGKPPFSQITQEEVKRFQIFFISRQTNKQKRVSKV
jgi:hypothetical protein